MPPKTQSSIADFLAQVPAARRKELQRVRSVVRKHLPAGYEETLTRGMIVYEVPLRRYADTYNGHPLWYAALASQKGYLALHLMPVCGSATLAQKLRDGFKAAQARGSIWARHAFAFTPPMTGRWTRLARWSPARPLSVSWRSHRPRVAGDGEPPN